MRSGIASGITLALFVALVAGGEAHAKLSVCVEVPDDGSALSNARRIVVSRYEQTRVENVTQARELAAFEVMIGDGGDLVAHGIDPRCWALDASVARGCGGRALPPLAALTSRPKATAGGAWECLTYLVDESRAGLLRRFTDSELFRRLPIVLSAGILVGDLEVGELLVRHLKGTAVRAHDAPLRETLEQARELVARERLGQLALDATGRLTKARTREQHRAFLEHLRPTRSKTASQAALYLELFGAVSQRGYYVGRATQVSFDGEPAPSVVHVAKPRRPTTANVDVTPLHGITAATSATPASRGATSKAARPAALGPRSKARSQMPLTPGAPTRLR